MDERHRGAPPGEPLTWRRSDEDFDLTTGLRFHPVESAITHASYLAVVAVLAPPLEAVIVVEFATMVQNFFAHANIRGSLRTWSHRMEAATNCGSG